MKKTLVLFASVLFALTISTPAMAKGLLDLPGDIYDAFLDNGYMGIGLAEKTDEESIAWTLDNTVLTAGLQGDSIRAEVEVESLRDPKFNLWLLGRVFGDSNILGFVYPPSYSDDKLLSFSIGAGITSQNLGARLSLDFCLLEKHLFLELNVQEKDLFDAVGKGEWDPETTLKLVFHPS